MKDKLNQYKHVLLLLYFPLYLAAFRYLENITPEHLHIISSPLDQYIPFLPVFIIPYLFWFVYIALPGMYFLFCEREVFCRLMYFGMIGMTVFLLISYVYPNGLAIRPEHLTGDSVFIKLTRYVYNVDTSTNVLPSIHVFNSIGIYLAVKDSENLRKKKGIRYASLTITVLIILSTMFVKQHSVVDVIAGLLLSCVASNLIYGGRAIQIWNNFNVVKYRKKERLKS